MTSASTSRTPSPERIGSALRPGPQSRGPCSIAPAPGRRRVPRRSSGSEGERGGACNWDASSLSLPRLSWLSHVLLTTGTDDTNEKKKPASLSISTTMLQTIKQASESSSPSGAVLPRPRVVVKVALDGVSESDVFPQVLLLERSPSHGIELAHLSEVLEERVLLVAYAARRHHGLVEDVQRELRRSDRFGSQSSGIRARACVSQSIRIGGVGKREAFARVESVSPGRCTSWGCRPLCI